MSKQTDTHPSEDGQPVRVLRRFGGHPQRLRSTVTELQRRLYAEAA